MATWDFDEKLLHWDYLWMRHAADERIAAAEQRAAEERRLRR